MANGKLFGLFIWINDNPICGNVLNLSNIVEPRKGYDQYKVGDLVKAKCPSFGIVEATVNLAKFQTYNSNSKSSPTSTLPSPSEDLDIKKPTCSLETVSTNLGTSPPAPPSFDHELCNGLSRSQLEMKISSDKDYRKATIRLFRLMFTQDEPEGRSLTGRVAKNGDKRPAIAN